MYKDAQSVMTVLEARVASENWPKLKEAFRSAGNSIDAGIEQSFLVQQVKDPELWRIITIWESQEALDRMRASGETPRGVLIFKAANAEPLLSVHKITGRITGD